MCASSFDSIVSTTNQETTSHSTTTNTIPGREQLTNSRGSRARSSGGRGYYYSNNSSENKKNSNSEAAGASNSLSSKLAKWTRKVQQGITCGATLPSGSLFTGEEAYVDDRDEETVKNSNTTMDHRERPTPEKPPRTKAMGKKVDYHNQYRSHSGEYEDHHTLATATTASATISYSTDQGDGSDVSEAGMEVVMNKEDTTTLDGVLIGRKAEPYVSHTFQAGKHTFTVDKRYSMTRVIGSGAYGVVISAKDKKSNQSVAIKMVPKAFSDEIDAKRILREIKLLNHFQHDNIVTLIDMMPPNVKYLEDFTDVYLVTDLMETDLHRIIYSKQKLSIDHVQYFVYQVLRGLKYIHSCNVLHRDLKPSNLLVNSNCDLKICDFGLARGIRNAADEDPSSASHGTMLLTEYVVTRWYRAPEIMLACHEYSYPIDVWSVGCIFAELILRKPYFPGDDYIDQVRKAVDADIYRSDFSVCRILPTALLLIYSLPLYPKRLESFPKPTSTL